MVKIKNIQTDSLVFESARAVFVIHEHMGMALMIQGPCDCPDQGCENKIGYVDWQNHLGFHHAGVHVRAFDIHGDTPEERVEFFTGLDKIIHAAVGDHVYRGITYHFTRDPAPTPEQRGEDPSDVLDRASPRVDPRWVDMVKWYWTWCQISNKDGASERLN